MKDLIIIGSGGVGRETAWIVEKINQIKPTWNILGFIDDNEELKGKDFNGYKVLGRRDVLNEFSDEVYVVISIANYKVKKDIVEYLNNRFKFATIVHPDVYVSNSITIGEGTIIYPGVIMTTNIEIGNHVIVSPKCGIGHDSVIKDYVSLLWNVNISGFDVIGEGTLIGSGATITQHNKICKNIIIGAQALVLKDINNEYSINIGIPCKEMKR